MDFVKESCEDFVAVLSEKTPVPGGGGASALVGAIGVALGGMVASLTVGKKKYAEVEERMVTLKDNATRLQTKLLELVNKDAEVFEPLSRAYGMPKDTEAEKAEKDKVMEAALRTACEVPLEIMHICCAAIELHGEFAEKGSVLAVSDAGVGVAFCKSALQGASLNVFINTKSMKDREYAEKVNATANYLLDKYEKVADNIYNAVKEKLTNQ